MQRKPAEPLTDLQATIREETRSLIRFIYFALACQTAMQLIVLHFFATYLR